MLNVKVDNLLEFTVTLYELKYSEVFYGFRTALDSITMSLEAIQAVLAEFLNIELCKEV